MQKPFPLWAVLPGEQPGPRAAGCGMMAGGLLAGKNQDICSVQGGLVSNLSFEPSLRAEALGWCGCTTQRTRSNCDTGKTLLLHKTHPCVSNIIRGQYGVQRMELLPGDRENLAIQTRGGPEKHEVTGWVLISPLSKEDAGEYECHASNAKGEATASAKIHVVETLHEIALTKDDGAEL
uniref:Insulin like growth factor binding protein 7 n=1 Tax=Serinus canaria TaxID=9135 RepID=A0A8C9UH29_SERCA